MTDLAKSRKIASRAVFGALALCGLCCALPLVGALAGVGSLTAAVFSWEWAAAGLLAVALLVLAWTVIRRRRASQCALDCDCGPIP
jgi:hypothetical protein